MSEYNTVVLELPYPPSGNHMWKHTRAGKHYLTPAALAFYSEVAFIVMADGRKGMITEHVQVTCWLYPPDKRKRDLENAWKVISDGITKAGVWEDDSLVRKLLIEWRAPEKNGRVVVRIEQYAGDMASLVTDCV